MNMKWVKGSIAVLGLASVAVHLVTRERALSAERAAQSAMLGDLREQVERLGEEQKKSALFTRVSTMQMMRAEPNSDSSRFAWRPWRDDARTLEDAAERSEAAETAPPPDPVERAEAELEEYRGVLEDTFTTEGFDPSWAPDAERVASSALSAALPESSWLTDVTCHETLCRAEVTHASIEGHRDLLSRLAKHIEWAGPSAILRHETASGEVKTLAYLGRVDAAFPSLAR